MENDSKQYTDFEVCETKKDHKYYLNRLVYEAKQFMLTKQSQRASTYFGR